MTLSRHVRLLVVALAATTIASAPDPARHGRPDRPSPRSSFMMVWDARRDRVVLHGGTGDLGAETVVRNADTWAWSGGTWTRLSSEGPGRSDGAMAYDAGRDRVVLFGGVAPGARTGDTWEFDGERWAKVAETGPPARALAAMAYDPVRGRVVLYGGSGADRAALGDTWEWDGAAWKRIEAEGPGPLGAHAMTWDAGRGAVVLFGGYGSDEARGELWAWDGTAWTLVDDSGPRLLHTAVAHDPTADRLVVFGGFGDDREGDTWVREANGWRRLDGAGPPARAEHEAVWMGGAGLFVFGGVVGQGMEHEDRVQSDDAWLWDGTAWSAVDAGTPSAGSGLPEGASSDPSRRPVATYSIVARDPATGELGVAVQSHWFSVGPIVPWAEAGVGAVATQSFVDPAYGPLGLALLKGGKTAAQALAGLLEADAHPEGRQVAIVDAAGGVAAHTGANAIFAAGHATGENYSVQANLMEHPTVWPAMARAFEAAQGDLAERMLVALEAAEAEGGDVRGRQSAALLVVSGTPTGKPWVDRTFDLRIEDHPAPLVELRRLLHLARAYREMNAGDEAMTVSDLAAAVGHYDAAARMEPENAEMVFWAAATLAGVGRVDEALPRFERAFAADPRWAVLVARLPAAKLLPDDPALLDRILAIPGGEPGRAERERIAREGSGAAP